MTEGSICAMAADGKRGRKRKYTEKSLRKAVLRYFDSICREKTMTEKTPTKDKDAYGHTIYVDTPVLNKLGEPVVETAYLLPPTVGGLCTFLGVTRETWSQWQDENRFPEFADTIRLAQGRMRAWNEQELLTREGKDVRGIIFNLQNNYGYSDRKELELGEKTRAHVQTAGMSLQEKLAAIAQAAKSAADLEKLDGEDDG